MIKTVEGLADVMRPTMQLVVDLNREITELRAQHTEDVALLKHADWVLSEGVPDPMLLPKIKARLEKE